MADISISQEELNKLLQVSKIQKSSPKKTVFHSSNVILKIRQKEEELTKQLKELRITVSQKEVDDLFDK